MMLLGGINTLWKDREFLKTLSDEGLLDRPDLAGDFAYDS
jgi:hypothetical protein